jgi:two-component system, NtrC family, response regulator HydG
MDRSEPGTFGARILLIDDDRVFGAWARQALASTPFEITHVLDPLQALHHVEAGPWDLVITDVLMPSISGLELIDHIRQLEPSLPIAVATAHATVDMAVSALRQSAVEFIQKPITQEEFKAKVTRLVALGRARRASIHDTVLAIGAHPDDVEIGAAGTLLAHRTAGDTVAILTLSRGAHGGTEAQRATESEKAAHLLGARLFLDDLEDTRISEGNPTIGIIERVVAEIQPTVIFTHSAHDVHQDHRNTNSAVMVAARKVGRVLCFQSPSATVDFRPTHFVTVDEYIDGKLKVIDAFSSQASVREYLEPDLIAATSRYWSRFCDGDHAEAFEVVRDRAAARLVPSARWPSAGAAPPRAVQRQGDLP